MSDMVLDDLRRMCPIRGFESRAGGLGLATGMMARYEGNAVSRIDRIVLDEDGNGAMQVSWDAIGVIITNRCQSSRPHHRKPKERRSLWLRASRRSARLRLR